MPILFIIDARLRIHRSSLPEDFDRALQGKCMFDLVDDDSCARVEQWWKENPYSPLRLPITALPKFEEALGDSQEWLVTPLISSSGSVDFAAVEGHISEVDIPLPPASESEAKTQEKSGSADARVEAIHRELELMHDVATLANASLDSQETLERLAEQIVKRKQYNHVAFYLLDGENLVRSASAGGEPSTENASIPLGEGPVGRAGYEGTPVILSDTDEAEWVAIAQESRSLMAVPIVTKAMVGGEETESVSGVIVLESDETDAFGKEDIHRMSSIASSAAMAIENDRLLRQTISLLQSESNQRQEVSRQKVELDEFVHTISHDLRNPLNNISGFAELLGLELDEKADGQVLKYLDRIEANAAVISRMIRDLLELSRVGRVDDEREPMDMEQLMKEIKFDFTMSHEESGLELNVFNMPTMVIGNSRRLHQLFSNLIGNAVKYAHPDRTPRVNIACVDEEDTFCFSVGDNGIGIDKNHINSIFVFGVRVREKEVDGTGAGLAISKKIVESHEGHIWVESDKGEGSTFYFTLPKATES